LIVAELRKGVSFCRTVDVGPTPAEVIAAV